MTEKNYYYSNDPNEQLGPFSTDKIVELINSSVIGRNTLMWESDMNDWEKAISISEFKDEFRLPPPLPVQQTPPPLNKTEKIDLNQLLDKGVGFFRTNWKIVSGSLALLLLVTLCNKVDFPQYENSVVEGSLAVDLPPTVSEVLVSDLTITERGRLITDNVSCRTIQQPSGGYAVVQVTNNSAEYSFEFSRMHFALKENGCWFLECEPSKNLEVNASRINPGDVIELEVPISSSFSIKYSSLLRGESETNIYRKIIINQE